MAHELADCLQGNVLDEGIMWEGYGLRESKDGYV